MNQETEWIAVCQRHWRKLLPNKSSLQNSAKDDSSGSSHRLDLPAKNHSMQVKVTVTYNIWVNVPCLTKIQLCLKPIPQAHAVARSFLFETQRHSKAIFGSECESWSYMHRESIINFSHWMFYGLKVRFIKIAPTASLY